MKFALIGLLCLASTITAAPKGENISGRIINGYNVPYIGKAPYHVAIMHDDGYVCGGALITEDSVITAAHCVYR